MACRRADLDDPLEGAKGIREGGDIGLVDQANGGEAAAEPRSIVALDPALDHFGGSVLVRLERLNVPGNLRLRVGRAVNAKVTLRWPQATVKITVWGCW